jgi:hypothetical protein
MQTTFAFRSILVQCKHVNSYECFIANKAENMNFSVVLRSLVHISAVSPSLQIRVSQLTCRTSVSLGFDTIPTLLSSTGKA